MIFEHSLRPVVLIPRPLTLLGGYGTLTRGPQAQDL